MEKSSRIFNASTTDGCGLYHFGCLVMMSLADKWVNVSLLFNILRKSPSVMIPDYFVVFHHGGNTKTFFRYFENHFFYGSIRRNGWFQRIFQDVSFTRSNKFFAQGTTRMVFGKIIAGEIAQLHQANGKRITHNKLCRGAVGRSQLLGAGFSLNRRVQHVLGFFCQEGSRVPCYGYQLISEIFYQGDEGFYFGTIAAF